MGPLNVTGLVDRRDLPKQFESPPDLKLSFQNQLLGQDFTTDRMVVCSILKVNTKTGPDVTSNLKLSFEEFGSPAVVQEDALDKILSSIKIDDNVGATSNVAYDNDDEDDSSVVEDVEIRELFDELCAGKVTIYDYRNNIYRLVTGTNSRVDICFY